MDSKFLKDYVGRSKMNCMNKKIIEKIKNNNNYYEFDFSDSEDMKYVMDSFGGEDNLKENYPLVYQALCASERKNNILATNEMKNNVDKLIEITELSKEKDGDKSLLHTVIGGSLPDYDYTIDDANDGKPLRSWPSGNITIEVYNRSNPAEVFYSDAYYFQNKNHLQYDGKTEYLNDTQLTSAAVSVMLTAFDPDGNIKSCAAYKEVEAGELIDVVHQIVIEDPASQCNNSPIIMLYGRRKNQNDDYKNADYFNDGDGEYFKNSPQNHKLKTIVPLKGRIELVPGCKIDGTSPLYKPDPKDQYPYNVLTRPQIKVNNYTLTLYKKQNDTDAYESLKSCFSFDDSGAYPTIYFDIAKPNNGGHDWEDDLELKGDFKNNSVLYKLQSGFRLGIIDPYGLSMKPVFTIKSCETKELPAGKSFYVSNTPNVYVPFIKVYWGCFARDTMVRLNTGMDKRMDQLSKGDKVVTAEGNLVTFMEHVIGEEEKIFVIKTEEHEIGLTGGHPVLMEDGSIKFVRQLRIGDRLKTFRGGADVLEKIEKDYHDEVFSPIFEESGEEGVFILANGFYCGDYMAQNRQLPYESTYTEEQKELFVQFEALTNCIFENRGTYDNI